MKNREVIRRLLVHGIVNGGVEVIIARGKKDTAVVNIVEFGSSEVGVDEFLVDWASHGYMV